MTAALTWLNDLFQWIGRWIPRLVLIHVTHRGVRFGPRGTAREVGPGLVVYWPITHALIQVPITLQSIQLCGTQLPLKDDAGLLPRVAILTLNIQFEVRDAVKAATGALNFHALVSNRAQAIALRSWPGSMPTDDDWLRRTASVLRLEMEDIGIDVRACEAGGVGIGVALKNVSDWTWQDRPDGKREGEP